jgi:hypothetical protein
LTKNGVHDCGFPAFQTVVLSIVSIYLAARYQKMRIVSMSKGKMGEQSGYVR